MKKLAYIRAHLLASVIAAIAGIVTAQLYMGLQLGAVRMMMGVLFAPLLAPVSVVLVFVTAVLRHKAPQAHFAAMAIAYLIAMGLIIFIIRKRVSDAEMPR